ncbi:MAG: hypothetical protein KAS88_05540 [Deltaproteobacteria bacterium]|nr:hypothetical protein [Deltaproteobacteria bacterium]
MDRLETIDVTYSDHEAAVKAGEIERGWMPTYIPTSAKEIRTRHNIDTNNLWWSFYYDPKDYDFMDKSCKKAEKNDLLFTRKRQAFDWWPEELIDGSSEFLDNEQSYNYYTCDKTANLAVDTTKSKAYLWDFRIREWE